MAASSSSRRQPEFQGLKYLGFVELFAEKATKHVANVYAFTKDSTGPFKPTVDGVATTVKIIIGPVCEKLDGKPHELLLFVEKKVDHVVDGALFSDVRKKSLHAYDIARQIPEIILLFADELQNGHIVDTVRMCYMDYEPIVEELSIAAWKKFFQMPYVSRAVSLAMPATLFCAKSFNYVMKDLKEMHVPGVDFIPSIPLEKLEWVLKVQRGQV